MTPAQKVAAVLAACAMISPLVVKWEGWRTDTYPDVTGIPTACAGETAGIVPGKTYTDRECMDRLAVSLASHGVQIDRCLPDELPIEMRAAFTSAAYNIGAQAFCSSSMSRKALAGDYAGACAALSLWVRAGGRVVAGLTNRRQAEREYCERGLH